MSAGPRFALSAFLEANTSLDARPSFFRPWRVSLPARFVAETVEAIRRRCAADPARLPKLRLVAASQRFDSI